MRPTRRHQRRGVSLVETVLIVGSITVLLSICAAFLHLLLRVDRAGRAAVTEARAVARLARQFRQDVRAADSARLAGPDGDRAASLDLSRPGGINIAYRTERGRLLRIESAREKPRRREGYTFAGLGPATFAVHDQFARVTLDRAAGAPGMTRRPGFRVEARLGKDAERSRREPIAQEVPQ